MTVSLLNKVIGLLLCMHAWSHAQIACTAPGISYQCVGMENAPQKIHVVHVNPKQVTLCVEAAQGICIGAETTSDIAQRNHAAIAVNGGFFDFVAPNRFAKLCIKALDALGYTHYKTVPVYALKIKGNWFSLSPLFTGAIAWDKDGNTTMFDIGKTSIELKIGDTEYPVLELNKPYSHAPTIYSSVYDDTTPKSTRRIVEIIVADGSVQKVLPNSHGKTIIPKNGFVYAYPKKMYLIDNESELEGQSASLNVQYVSRRDDPAVADAWNDMDYIVAGTPLLIQDGQIISTLFERTTPFYTKKYPRTAIGILQDGTLVLAVIEGRSKESAGFTILELAHYMQQLGCVHALNLDGGGSSSMVVNGVMVNEPAGHEWGIVKKERPVSHALLMKSRNGIQYDIQ